MAKKVKSFAQIMEEAKELTKNIKQVQKIAAQKTKGCKNHADVMRGLCKPCYEIDTNTTLEAKLAKEPWISTNGYKYCYDENGEPELYHRRVARDFLGRDLFEGERIAFLNKDKSDCRPENLGVQKIIPLSDLS